MSIFSYEGCPVPELQPRPPKAGDGPRTRSLCSGALLHRPRLSVRTPTGTMTGRDPKAGKGQGTKWTRLGSLSCPKAIG